MTINTTTATSLFIAGQWVAPEDGGSLEIRNPAERSVVGTIGYGSKADALAAVDAAREAFASWAGMPARARADILQRAGGLLNERAGRIGYILALESGKRLPEAVAEVRFAAEYFRWFAEQARRPAGELLPQEIPNRRHLMLAQPVGVALCLTPWNFPVSIQARKVAPALAAGCTTVSRASEKAPLAVIEMFHCRRMCARPTRTGQLQPMPGCGAWRSILSR